VPAYDVFARFYDAVEGDAAERAAYVRALIERHCSGARSVLELACGTGSILAQLRPDFDVTGLDVSAPMLEVAEAKLPGVRLVPADMTDFDLDTRFDVVLCVYDSINHLLDFELWRAVFARAHEHLNDCGVFLFDVNTERRLAGLCEHPPVVHSFGRGHLLVMDVQPEICGVVGWHIRIFERERDGRYRLHDETISEVSFPRAQIAEALRERFRRVAAHDRRRQRVTAATERIHFVATK
jgi:SAM-dependent methyltransferase